MLTEKNYLKYVDIAVAVSNLSKSRTTKVGALILGSYNEIRSVGYNGSPRGCSADEDTRGAEAPEKYFWLSHAELNAITNAARVGTPLQGTTLVVTHFPCMECAKAIVQSGITHVIVASMPEAFKVKWGNHISRSKELFRECGVTVVEVENIT